MSFSSPTSYKDSTPHTDTSGGAFLEPTSVETPLRPILLQFVKDFFEKGFIEITCGEKTLQVDSIVLERIQGLVAELSKFNPAELESMKDNPIKPVLYDCNPERLSRNEAAYIYKKIEIIFSVSILHDYLFSLPTLPSYMSTIDGLGQGSKSTRHGSTVKLLELGCPSCLTDKVIHALILLRPFYRLQKETTTVLSTEPTNDIVIPYFQHLFPNLLEDKM